MSALYAVRAAEGQLAVIAHVTPAEVAALPEYRAWMDAFGGGARHLLANTAACAGCTVMGSSARVQVCCTCDTEEPFHLVFDPSHLFVLGTLVTEKQ